MKEIRLTERLLSYPGVGHESQLTAFENILKDASDKSRGSYRPTRMHVVNIHDLDGVVHNSQPVLHLDGRDDEAVVWEKPNASKRRPDFELYKYELIS